VVKNKGEKVKEKGRREKVNGITWKEKEKRGSKRGK
jgi:hypothetical protein